jgi:tetratricopeptide (TPR) repeat protein
VSGLPPISAPRESKRNRIVVAVACVLGVLAGFALVLSVFGIVNGSEFCPQRFWRRGFSYYRIPLVNVQITPIVREDKTNDLERYLWMKKLIPKDPNPQRWDLVQVNSSGVPVWDGDARLLCTYLDLAREIGQLDLLEWTKNNMAAAQVLWPSIAKIARQRLYFLAPDIMEMAQNTSDPKRLEEELDQYLISAYMKLATTYQELNEQNEAIRLFGLTLEEDHHWIPALLGRADSYEKVGQTKKATVDRELAKQLSGDEQSEEDGKGSLEGDEESTAAEEKGLSDEIDKILDDADFSFGF